MEVVIEVGGFQPVVVVEVGVVTALAIALAVVFIIRPNDAAMVLATDVGTVDDLVAVNGASRKSATSLGAVPSMAPAFLIECCLILSKRFSFFIEISEILFLFFLAKRYLSRDRFTKNARLELAHFLVMLRDLLDAFQHQGTDPDAEIGGHHVHQTETGDHFEAMNVELRRADDQCQCSR